jgi:hypothetical protein
MGSRGYLPKVREQSPARKPSTHPAKVPTPPSGLGPVGKKAWQLAWEYQTSHYSDELTIRRFVEVEDEIFTLGAELDADGRSYWKPMISPTTGKAIGAERLPHPSVRSKRDAEKVAVMLSDRLGLSAHARARLGLAMLGPSAKRSELDEINARRKKREAERRRRPGSTKIISGEGARL